MTIRFNSFQFAVSVKSPYDDNNMLDFERIISLDIQQAVRNNITGGNTKFYTFDLM